MGLLWLLSFAAAFVGLILGSLLVSFIIWRIARGRLRRRGIKAGSKRFHNTFLTTYLFGFALFAAGLFALVLYFPDKAKMAAAMKTVNGFSASRITVELNTEDRSKREYFVDAFTPFMKTHQRRIAYREHSLRSHTRYTLESQISSRYRIDGRKIVFITARPLSTALTQRLIAWARAEVERDPSIERISFEQIHFVPRTASGDWIEVP